MRDNSSNLAISADIFVKVKTGASGVSADGYAAIYLVRSHDGTDADDAFAGSDAAITPVNATLLGIMLANANDTTYQKVIDTQQLGITLPAKYAIAVVNKTGAALAASGSGIDIREKYYTAA